MNSRPQMRPYFLRSFKRNAIMVHMKKFPPYAIMLLVLVALSSSCSTVKDIIRNEPPSWTADVPSSSAPGWHNASGSSDDEDPFLRTEHALADAREELSIWALSAAGEIADLYMEKAGSRADGAVRDAFLSYAPGYVPAWISSASEIDRWEKDGKLSILLSLDTARMRSDLESFSEIVVSKVVEQKEARNNARLSLMAAVDEWFSGV